MKIVNCGSVYYLLEDRSSKYRKVLKQIFLSENVQEYTTNSRQTLKSESRKKYSPIGETVPLFRLVQTNI